MNIQEAIAPYAGQPLTQQLLQDILKDYKRPFDKITELVKQDLLIQVKRGLYIPGERLKLSRPVSFLLANHLYGPSYVSMDSALSFWGLIPERVYEISSATPRAAKKYTTEAGRFSYTRLPLPYYSYGIRLAEVTTHQTVLMASPEKALCDKIITTSKILLRSMTQTMDLLTGDFRIEKSSLQKLDAGAISRWAKMAPKKTSLTMLVKTLNNL
ncbi:MAG: hypothetical protein HZA79_14605 [Sphingobacteriales bacterium]|nr:hypothetical protein [Sphingobacteriales bacterium]